jgi:hypothetical protein
MSTTVVFRNALTDARQVVEVQSGQTVKQAVENSGFMAAGSSFSVRDKNGQLVDDQQAAEHVGEVLSVGLPGDRVVGGTVPSGC